jgi:hypothetical protein
MPYADPEKRKTVKRESARRRRHRFATDDPRELPAPPDEDELLRIAGQLARSGSVQAVRLLLERLDRQAVPDDAAARGSSVIADLAKRRAERTAH